MKTAVKTSYQIIREVLKLTLLMFAELVEKHLQLQDKKLWVDSLGIVNQRLFKTVYEALPEQAKAKGEPKKFNP